MEPTGLVYVTLTISGIFFAAPQPVTAEECQALRNANATVMCIDKRPDCGKHSDTPCIADLQEQPPAKKRKRTYVRRRIVRR